LGAPQRHPPQAHGDGRVSLQGLARPQRDAGLSSGHHGLPIRERDPHRRAARRSQGRLPRLRGVARAAGVLLTRALHRAWMLALVSLTVGCAGGAASLPPATIPVDDTTLGTGDVFEVRVYGEPELTGRYRVAQDGSIDFPLVGRLAVAEREPTEVADALREALREGEYLRDPQLSVMVVEYNSKKITV